MAKPKLFITPSVMTIRRISQEYVDSLRQRFDVLTVDKLRVSRDEFLALCKDQNAILGSQVDCIDRAVAEAAGDSLKVVSIASAGYDNLNTNDMKARGIRVGLAGSVITNATAELALTLLLAASRKLVPLLSQYKSDPKGYFQKTKIPIMGLENSTIGIVGAGRIGQSVAKKVIPFEINRLLYYSRSEKPEMRKMNGELCSLENIARLADYLIVTLAYNADTDKIISKRILDSMKPNAIIVNVGRGGLIDQDALVEVLRSKKIGGAALDVTTPEPLPSDHPLLHLDNALIAPHLGGLTTAVEKNAVDLAAKNIIAYFDNEKMPEELIL